MGLALIQAVLNLRRCIIRIYVSGPYSAPTLKGILSNVRRACDVAYALIQMGHQPYIPHLTHFLDVHLVRLGISISWERWIELDLAWLKVSEGFFLVGHSPGADIELGHAQLLGLQIYCDLNQVPKGGL